MFSFFTSLRLRGEVGSSKRKLRRSGEGDSRWAPRSKMPLTRLASLATLSPLRGARERKLCRALLRAIVERLAHAPRLQEVLRRQHVRGPAPRDRLARQQQRLRKHRLDQIEIMQRRDHGALLGMPAPDEIAEVRRSLGVDRVERFVEYDH